MNYRDAKKIKVGDVVVNCFGERHKVTSVEDSTSDKCVFIKLGNHGTYSHTAIKEIEAKDKMYDKYYQILAFNPPDKIDEVCSTHIYPTYVSCMSVKGHYTKPCCFEDMCNHPTMLQSNPYDGLKFVDRYNAEQMLEIVKRRLPEKEFKIIEVDALCFGRTKHRWVVSL